MSGRSPVWIDTDPTVIPGGHEVDDGIALALAFRSPELLVVGVSSIFGNGDIDRCHASAEAMIAAFAPHDMVVHRGAARAGDFAATPAAKALIAAVLQAPPPGMVILALGPLTNIAAAIALEPAIVDRIQQIIWVAGRLPDQQFRASDKQERPFPDLNFESDVVAARTVMNSGIPIALTSWTVCSKVRFGRDQVAQLATADAALRVLYRPASDWLDLWSRNFAVDYFMPFDTLAVAHACGIGTLTGFDGVAWIDPCAKPILVAAPGCAHDQPVAKPRPIWFATDVDPQFIDILIDRLIRPNPA